MSNAPITLVVNIAETMLLTPAQALVLPTAVSVCARKVDMTEWAFAEQLMRNPKLRDYVAGIIKQIAG